MKKQNMDRNSKTKREKAIDIILYIITISIFIALSVASVWLMFNILDKIVAKITG